MSSQPILLVPGDESLVAGARELAAQWGFQLGHEAGDSGYYLLLEKQGLSLIQRQQEQCSTVHIDFVGGELRHRRLYGGGKRQPLGRAVGLHKKSGLKILDATAGLGRDAFVLAALGCEITLVERSAVVAALLTDALARAREDEEIGAWIKARMHLVHADSITYMDSLAEEQRPDVVYLDPMFPHRSKSAKVKKGMQALQGIIGQDEDRGQLLKAALQCTKSRVVVKRPAGAPNLSELKPALVVETKKNRFDVYLV